MSIKLNLELAPLNAMTLSSQFKLNATYLPSEVNKLVRIQTQCILAEWAKDICHRVHCFVMRTIQSIKDCFSGDQSTATLNGNTVSTPLPLNIISFYRGQEANNNGVTIDQMLAWDDGRLESVHNYIQWLFPLKSRGQFNPTAPALNDATIQAFRCDQALKNQVLRSFRRMLSFYGLQMNEASKVILRAPTFNARSAEWLINPSGHHNFLRITRIIHSMNLLGHSDYSHSFFNIMRDIHNNEGNGIITANTLGFWRSAASQAG